jgi:hypothetical protein
MDPWADLLADEDEHDPAIGPSDAGVLGPRGCERQLAYRVQQVPATDAVPDWLSRWRVLGKVLHAAVATARQNAHPNWLVEHALAVPGFDRPGTLDAYAPESGGQVDDLKTTTDNAFRWLADGGQGRTGDQHQAELYGLALTAAGPPVARLSLTYLNRSSGETWTDTWSYDPAAARRTALAMYAVIDRTGATAPADIPRGGKAPHWAPCDTCRWRANCWGIEPGASGEGVVGALAAEADVARAAEHARELRAERARIDDALDYCKELLMGHDGKTFIDRDGTPRRVRWSDGKPAGAGGALDQAAARALLEHYGEAVPTLGVAPRLTFPAVR